MKDFRQYLAESVKPRYFLVKTAFKPTDEQLDIIETYLNKYDLIDFVKPELLENDTLDFINVPDREVWCAKFAIAMPITQYMLVQQLKSAMNVNEDLIIIRSATEPVELEVQDAAFKNDGLQSAARLGTDRFYDDQEQPLLTDLYGDNYNQKLVDYLANVKSTRRSEKYDPPAPLFSWLDMDRVMKEQAVDSEDFNKNYDTVKPVTGGRDTLPVDAQYLGAAGNLDDAAAKRVKFVKKTPEGRGEAISAPRATKKR
jgi:hypothetical protein